MTVNPSRKHLVLLGAGRAHLQVLKPLARQSRAVLSDSVPEEIIAGFHRAPADLSTSIMIDRLHGRPLEWDIRNGVVQRRGRQHGIPDAAQRYHRAAAGGGQRRPGLTPGWRGVNPPGRIEVDHQPLHLGKVLPGPAIFSSPGGFPATASDSTPSAADRLTRR